MIRFESVRKSFGERKVLRDISFEIHKGEIVFVLGTSGTGKSVLLKNLVGLMRPDHGKIWIDGEEVSGFSEEQYMDVRKKCGMVFQQPALFDSLTIFENVAFGLRRHYKFSEEEIKTRVLRALSLVHLTGIENKMPQEISYGMQKRVSLARTVALEPKILLFDEPTTGLDPITTQAVNELIQELSRKLGTTSVVVSHDMMCALGIADRIFLLDQGQLADQGTPEEMKRSTHPMTKDFLSEVTS